MVHPGLLEVILIAHGPISWEWQVRNRDQLQLLNGYQESRANAQQEGDSALFSILARGMH